MNTAPNPKPVTSHLHPVREGCCPSCGQHTHFIFLGEQRWPERVAAKLGLPPVMLQWSYESCHTTISEPGTSH